jgi:hypothetical protein
MRTLLLMPALLVGCTPHLTTPKWARDGDGTGSGADWEAPSNSWPAVEAVPADLVAEGFTEGLTFPDIRLMDQHGDIVSVWQFYGMVIAVDISTMWCGPCNKLAKEVDHTWESYADRGFMYLTMLPEDSEGGPMELEDTLEWVERHDIVAPILADDQGYSYDIVPNQIWPRVLVIGRDMRVTNDEVLPAEDAAIRAAIEAAL